MSTLLKLAERVEGLTEAQRRALKMVERRDWPAGEPRVSWFHKTTYAVLKRLGLVEERLPDVVHLTAAGRAALARIDALKEK